MIFSPCSMAPCVQPLAARLLGARLAWGQQDVCSQLFHLQEVNTFKWFSNILAAYFKTLRGIFALRRRFIWQESAARAAFIYLNLLWLQNPSFRPALVVLTVRFGSSTNPPTDGQVWVTWRSHEQRAEPHQLPPLCKLESPHFTKRKGFLLNLFNCYNSEYINIHKTMCLRWRIGHWKLNSAWSFFFFSPVTNCSCHRCSPQNIF